MASEATLHDFDERKTIGLDIDKLVHDKGYDHTYVLENFGGKVRPAARLIDPLRVLEVFTDRPGLQVYTANWWDGSLIGAQNCKYGKHSAIALETQNFLDAPNHDHFPNSV
jgi:aldose 1-epimerase